MAGGKQTPRQKMINLMYLVFIAMMALNMSKEVLTAFGIINEKLVENNISTTERNRSFMAGLEAKVEEQPAKYKPLKEKADSIAALSERLYTYIERLKAEALKGYEGEKAQDYQAMDKPDALDELLFSSGKASKAGEEFLAEIAHYREEVSEVIEDDFPQVAADVRNEFETGEVTDSEGVTKPWLNYHYEGYPLIASVTKLTQMQSDIKSNQSEILSSMLSGQLQSEVSLTNYNAIVIPEKTAFFSGENFRGKVVLGRFDNTLQFENVIVNGRDIENTVGGQVILDFPAGNVGEQEITGELQYIENDTLKSIPIESSYAVIPKPNSAVISADKMNVVYRGVDNPMTISIPGVGNVTANAPGLRPAGGAGKYVMNVTTLQANQVTINVSGRLPGGETVSDSKTFRVKGIPAPIGSVLGETGTVRIPRANLEIATISATLPDFDFDLDLRVSGFKMKVPGQPTVEVRGQKLNDAAKQALRQAGRGETITIFDIEAQIAGGSSYKLPNVSPVMVELTN